MLLALKEARTCIAYVRYVVPLHPFQEFSMPKVTDLVSFIFENANDAAKRGKKRPGERQRERVQFAL